MRGEEKSLVIKYDEESIEKFVKEETNKKIVNEWRGFFQLHYTNKDDVVKFAEKFITEKIPERVSSIVFHLLSKEEWIIKEPERRLKGRE